MVSHIIGERFHHLVYDNKKRDNTLFSSAIIPPEDNQCRVINYLIAYTTKQSNLDMVNGDSSLLATY